VHLLPGNLYASESQDRETVLALSAVPGAVERGLSGHGLSVLLAAATEVRMTRCKWTLDTDEWNGDSWDTTCGERFVFMNDGPLENRMRFCPYCGGDLEEVRPSPEPDDE
jgi:hypothetical protein